MTTPLYGPCAPWEPLACVALTGAAAAASGVALEAATETLWAASGRQFGLCERTVRPCREECFGAAGFGSWWEWSSGIGWGAWPRPYLFDGNWYNLACGACPGSCSCTVLEQTRLPGPVNRIVQVKLNGSIMASGSYRVDEDQVLVRTDGGRWPTCQDMAAEDDQPDTWSVTAEFGVPVPTLGAMAVGELMAEYAKACAGQDCRLPANVANLVKQGVSIEFNVDDPFYERLYFVKNFLDAYNPKSPAGQRLSMRPRVFDVDGNVARRNRTAL